MIQNLATREQINQLNSDLQSKIEFIRTTKNFSIGANSVVVVNPTLPTNNDYKWRPMTGYIETGAMGIMSIQQKEDGSVNVYIRSFSSTSSTEALNVVWIGVKK